MPYIDQNDIYNNYNRQKVFFDQTASPGNLTTNFQLGNTFVKILTCPVDDSVVPGKGNLSYVVNMGFSRWNGYTFVNGTGTTASFRSAGTASRRASGRRWTGARRSARRRA